jgi:hypothetical protein
MWLHPIAYYWHTKEHSSTIKLIKGILVLLVIFFKRITFEEQFILVQQVLQLRVSVWGFNINPCYKRMAVNGEDMKVTILVASYD